MGEVLRSVQSVVPTISGTDSALYLVSGIFPTTGSNLPHMNVLSKICTISVTQVHEGGTAAFIVPTHFDWLWIYRSLGV